MLELGDLVVKHHPAFNENKIIRQGIVTKSSKDTITVHWLSYNKTFFMEFENQEFSTLNKNYLLKEHTYFRSDWNGNIKILSKAS